LCRFRRKSEAAPRLVEADVHDADLAAGDDVELVIQIEPDVFSGGDKDMLQDLIVAAAFLAMAYPACAPLEWTRWWLSGMSDPKSGSSKSLAE